MPCMVNRSHWARLEMIFLRISYKHCCVWGQLKKGCSYMSSLWAKTHRFSQSRKLCFAWRLFRTSLAVGQFFWSSADWLTGQPGDEESASSLPPSLYSTISPGPRQDSTADTHKPITPSYLILTPSKLPSMSNQPFRNRPLKWKTCV